MPVPIQGFGINGKSYYTNVAKPMDVKMTFTVDNTNALGITSLKSNGFVNNVFMHTTTTPGASNGFTNPNPAVGYAMIRLGNNFNKFLGHQCSVQAPNSGSSVKIDNSAMTAGQPYVITTLGNATLAKWQAIGLPPGITPAVGCVFIAATDGGTGNVLTSRVQAPSVSGIVTTEIIGTPSTEIANSNIVQNAGAIVMLQFLAPTVSTGAYVSPMVATAPANGSIVSLTLSFDGSSVTVDGL